MAFLIFDVHRACLGALAVVLSATGNPAVAQQSAIDSTLGTVVRVRTVRTGTAGAQPRRGAGEGLLIRTRGPRQRVDVLKSIDDTLGTEWLTSGEAPREMRIHSVAQSRTMVMKFSDLQTVFGSLMKMTFDSASAEAEMLGAGPRLLGYATERVAVRRSFRMQTTRNGKTQTMRVTSNIDALIAPAVPEAYGANSALSLTSGSTADLIEQIFGAGSSQVVVKDGRTLPRGLTLRSVSRSRTVSSGAVVLPFGVSGDTAVSVDSVEVLSIAQQQLADAIFAEPVGNAVVDFGEQIQKVTAMMDSLTTSLDALGKNRKPSKPYARPKPTSKPHKP